MHQSFDLSHQKISDVHQSQAVNQQHTIFQKYSRITSNNNSSSLQNNKFITKVNSENIVVQPKSVSRMQQTPNSNVDILYQQGEKQSLIQKVQNDDLEDSLSSIQRGRGLNGVIQSSSKIIHQAISPEHHRIMNQSFQQNGMVLNSVNTGSFRPDQQIIYYNGNNLIQGNNMRPNNVLRNTISSGQNVPPQRDVHYVSVNSTNQQFNSRGSLPSNINANHYMANQLVQKNTHYIQQQSNHIQQQNNRLSQHLPQNVNNLNRPQSNVINNNPNFRPIDFIQQGQQRLQKSQIVYKARNNASNNSQQQINLNQNPLNQPVNYVPQRGQSVESQRNHRPPIFQNNRGNSHSLERRKTHIVFNYNAQQLAQKNNRVIANQPLQPVPVQQIPIQKPPVQRKQTSLSPVSINPSPLKVVVQRSPTDSGKWKQKYFALYSKFSSLNQKVEYITESFYIYQKLIKTVTITQEKIITKHKKIKSVIQQLQQQCTSIAHQMKPTDDIKPPQQVSTKDQAHIQTKYKRLLFNFSKLQQQNNLIKLTFQQKINEVVKGLQSQNSTLRQRLQKIASKQVKSQLVKRLQSQNSKSRQQLKKSSKGQSQAKQKSKIMKRKSLQKISSILQRKQTQQLLLMSPLKKYKQTPQEIQLQTLQQWGEDVGEIIYLFQQQNEQLQIKYKQIEQTLKFKDQQVQRLKQLLNQKPYFNSNSQVLQSVDLTLSASQRFELEDHIAQYHQKSIFLQGQVQRLAQKNNKLSNALKQKQNQLLRQKKAAQSQYDLESVVTDLNNKLRQYQQNIYKIDLQLSRLTQRNQELQTQLAYEKSKYKTQPAVQVQAADNSLYIKDIQTKTRQIFEMQIQKASLQQKNIVLRDQLQRLNQKVSTIEAKLLQYQSQTTSLQTSQPITQQSQLLIQQYQFSISSLRIQITRKQSQLQRSEKISDQRIFDFTEQLKMSYKQKQNMQKRHDQKVTILQAQRQKRQVLIRQLRDKIYQLQQKRRYEDNQQSRRNQYVNKMASYSQNQQTNKLRSQIQTLRTQKQRISKDYQLQSKKLQQQIQQLKQDNIRLKKQIGQFADTTKQIQNLNEILNKKNMEILEIKNTMFENQKLAIQNTNLRRQVERIGQQYTRISSEYDKLNKTYLEVTRSLKDVEQSLNSLNHKFNALTSQYQLSLEANDRKDHQIVKLRQANQLLQTNVDQVQKQNDKLKVKIRNMQLTFEHEKNLLRQQIQNLKLKMADYDKLIRQKSAADHTITELQSLVQKYQYQLKQNQQQIIKQKTKIKTLESQNQDLVQQIQSLNQKFKQIQKKSAQNIKKYKKLNQQLQQKVKSLQEKQIKYQKQKISELQHDIKTKQNKIWKLEKEVEQLLERLDQIGDQEIDGQKISILEQKVKQYQARLFNQTFKYTQNNYDYQATKVFETKIIYQLKEENERLREFVSHKKTIKPTTDKAQNFAKAESRIKQVYDKLLDQVQGRLQAFNVKLQSLINNGSYQNIQVPLQKSRKSPSKIKIVQTENLQTINNLNVSSELRQFKLKYSQLQRYCKNIQLQLLAGSSKNITSAHQNVLKTSSQNSIVHDQITFHKQKNRQLQQRVDKLLKMNTQLKQNLQQLLKQRTQSSNLSYYKQQIIQLNQKINVLELRVKKLIDQNEKLKLQFGQQSKGEQNNLAKLYEYERKIIETQRYINEINLSKGSLEKQIQSLNQIIQSKQYQIKQLRSHLAMTSEKQSIQTASYLEKIQNYETQITKLTNRLRINESEIERINEVIKKKQLQSTQEISRWRVKVTQLQEQISKISVETQNQKSGQSSLKYEISRLTQEIKSFQYQNHEIKQANQNIMKKLHDSQSKLRDLQNQYYELQNELMGKRIDQSQFNMKFQQYESENVKFRNQVEFLKQQIQRLNQDIKIKQRNYDIQIQNLQGKISLTEREQFSYKKNVSILESQRQSFQDEIVRLKTQVSMYGAEIERRQGQFMTKQRLYEQKISMLKTQLTEIQASYISLQQGNSNWNTTKQRYQTNILELKNQILILKSQIQRLNSLLRQKQYFYQQNLQLNSGSWNQQKQSYQLQLVKVCNQRNIMSQQIERLNSQSFSYYNFKQKLQSQLSEYQNQVQILKSQVQRLNEILRTINSQQLNNNSSWGVQKQNYERQIAKFYNENLILKQQVQRLNFILLEKESMILTLRTESYSWLEERERLHIERQKLNNQIAMITKRYTSIAYDVQLIRSVYLEIQALFDQKGYSTEQEVQQINTKIAQQLQKGLQILVELNQILSG